MVSSIESKYNIDSNKIVDSKESSVNYSNQQRRGNKFKKKVYTKPPSSKVANPIQPVIYVEVKDIIRPTVLSEHDQ